MDIGQRTCCRPGASTIYSGMSIIGWTYLQSKPVWIKGTSHPYQISKRWVSDGSRGPARIALPQLSFARRRSRQNLTGAAWSDGCRSCMSRFPKIRKNIITRMRWLLSTFRQPIMPFGAKIRKIIISRTYSAISGMPVWEHCLNPTVFQHITFDQHWNGKWRQHRVGFTGAFDY